MRRFGLIVLLFIIPLFASNEPLTVQLRWYHQFQFAGYYAALHKGFYQAQGLDVKLVEGRAGINVVDEVLAGHADFGVSNSSLVVDYLKGKPILMLGVIFQHSPNILVTNPEYKSPVDLAQGGKVALMGGDQDVELKAMFLKEGIELDAIEFVPDKTHLGSFIDGSVQALYAYSSNEPFSLKQKNIPFTILEPRNYGLDFYGDVLFCAQAFKEQNPETIKKFRQATFAGWEYAMAHPEEMIALIQSHYNTQHKSAEHLRFEASVLSKLINPEFVQIGYSNPGRWEHIVEVYKSLGFVVDSKSLEPFYYIDDEEKIPTRYYYYFLMLVVGILLMIALVGYILRINQNIKKSALRHEILFSHSASAGIVWREGYIVTDWNHQAQKLFGWSRDEVLGRSFFEFLVPPEEKERLRGLIGREIFDGKMHVVFNRNTTKDGKEILCEWHNILLPNTSTDTNEIVSLAIDVTEAHQAKQQLQHDALHDALTDLPNRRYFDEVLNQLYLRSIQHKKPFALGLIDLDGFKAINDTFGHDAGDELLRVISARFKRVLRREDILARLGGDEFAFILVDTDDIDQAKRALERLLDGARQGVEFGLDKLIVSASIGLSVFDVSTEQEVAMLLREADNAMYTAKKAGKNRYTIFQ